MGKRQKQFGSVPLFIATLSGVEFAESRDEFAQNRRMGYTRQIVRVCRGRVIGIDMPVRDGVAGLSRTEVDALFRATMFAIAKHAYGNTAYAPEHECRDGDGI